MKRGIIRLSMFYGSYSIFCMRKTLYFCNRNQIIKNN